MYTDPNDLKTRFNSTYCRLLSGEYVYLEQYDGSTYKYTDLATGDIGEINLQRRPFPIEFEPLPLGYCRSSHGPVYYKRQPMRKYKQGLCAHQVRYLLSTGETGSGFVSKGKHLIDMFSRRYFGFDYAVDEIDAGYEGHPISNTFALYKRKSISVLARKGIDIAIFNKSGTLLFFKEEYLRYRNFLSGSHINDCAVLYAKKDRD